MKIVLYILGFVICCIIGQLIREIAYSAYRGDGRVRIRPGKGSGKPQEGRSRQELSKILRREERRLRKQAKKNRNQNKKSQ